MERRNVAVIIKQHGMAVHVFHGLRIGFNISLVYGRSVAQVNVYNLNRYTNFSLSTSVKGTTIDIVIGYGNFEQILYRGNVTNVSVTKNGTEVVTTFYAHSQVDEHLNTNRNFGIRTPYVQVINTLITDLIVGNPNLIRGYVHPVTGEVGRTMKKFGNVLDELEKICKDADCSLVIQNNFVNVYSNEIGGPAALFEVNSESGLISTPVISLNAMEFQAILDARFLPGNAVRVESFGVNLSGEDVYYQDFFGEKSWAGRRVNHIMMESVTHNGDTHSSTWQSSVKGHLMEGESFV